jgi:hypothetical protein
MLMGGNHPQKVSTRSFAMPAKVVIRKPKASKAVHTVSVRLPLPLPNGLKVVYWEETGGYALAATSKVGLRNLVQLGMTGNLG